MGGKSEWVHEGTNDDRQEFKYVGTWGHPGRQSWDMTSGAAKYPTDLNREGTLTAMCLRCPYGHAKVKHIDTSEAEKLPGVKLILTYEDEEIAALPKKVPSYYEFGRSPLLGDEGEFEGDEVGAVVVAESEEICRYAIDLLAVDWEVLPFILDAREAGKPGAPILRPEMNPESNLTGNTFGAALKWEIGHVEEALKDADYIETVEYGRPMWSQFRSMPPAYFSYWDDDPWGNPDGEKMCYVTNHAHFATNGPLVSASMGLDLSEDHFRALTPYMASRYCDFVEKRGALLAPVLSRRLGGAPVRMVSTRRQSFDACVPETFYTIRIGFNEDGTLVAVQSKNVHQVGARGGYGDKTHGHLVLPPNAQAFKSTGCPNIYSEMEYYVTNGACTTADPGKDQWEPVNLVFAKIADTLGMDITDVIMKNVKITQPSLETCMKAGKEAFGWDEKWHLAGQRRLPDGRLHGVAARACWSMTWGMIAYNINLRLNFTDGKVYMPYSEALIGTYWPDAVQLVIAEEMGMKPEDVIVYYAANYPNWQKGDAADRGATATWAAKEAAIRLKKQVLATAAPLLGMNVEDLDIIDSMISTSDGTPIMGVGGLNQFADSFCGKPSVPFQNDVIRTMNVDFCEVAVDPDTGLVEVLDYVAAHDFGKVIRPSSAMGQLEMAITMASGRALREEVIWDEKTGVLLNGNMYEYGVPTALDQPPMNNVAVETRCGGGAYGATGVAHAHINPGLIGTAIQNAIGAFIPTVPYTPDRVLRALGKIK